MEKERRKQEREEKKKKKEEEKQRKDQEKFTKTKKKFARQKKGKESVRRGGFTELLKGKKRKTRRHRARNVQLMVTQETHHEETTRRPLRKRAKHILIPPEFINESVCCVYMGSYDEDDGTGRTWLKCQWADGSTQIASYRPLQAMINYVPYVNLTVQYTHTYFFFHFDKIHTLFILYINKLVTDLFLCNFDACIIHFLYKGFF